MAPPLCHGVVQTYPIIRLAYIRLRQFVALVPLSHRATTVQRSIGWPVSKFWTPVELLRVVQILDNFPARVRTLTNLNIQLSQLGTTPARIVLQNAAPPFLSRSIRARMYGFFIFQHRQRLRDLRFFKVFAPVRQAPYIADNFGNIASCPDGGQLPALSAAPGWACGGFYSSGVSFPSEEDFVASVAGLTW